jgi:hypothetical protein
VNVFRTEVREQAGLPQSTGHSLIDTGFVLSSATTTTATQTAVTNLHYFLLSTSTSVKTADILWNPNVHYSCINSLALELILSQINLLKTTCYMIHQQCNIQQLYTLSTLDLCVLYLSQNKQRLVPLPHKLIGFL